MHYLEEEQGKNYQEHSQNNASVTHIRMAMHIHESEYKAQKLTPAYVI